ncbi:UNVERIFIED_CONTAM: hypothetical protein Sangu_3245700 [Sesamum angustifolium]|uniref:DUF4283 domain-containing protein n=1 Tax=Sesamum angustifolium TaxID=2727405 RepID=A0AAW2JH60_9LAMI
MLPKSPKTLCSLTHSTHTENLDHTTPDGLPEDGGELPSPEDIPDGSIEEDDPGGVLEGGAPGETSGDFDFEEFYDLATRVLNGDSDSLANLNSLKAENLYVAAPSPTDRYGDPASSTVSCWRFDQLGGGRPWEFFSIGPTTTENPVGASASSSPESDLVDSEDKEGQDPVHANPDCPTTLDSNLPLAQVDRSESALPVIYVGPRQAGPVDTIAGAFLQSSRKTLHFVPPTRQNGEVIIRPTKEVVDNGSKKWHTTAVGYFLGRRPYFPHLEAFARANWKGLQHVSATSSGFFFFRFHTRFAMEDVIEGGPWLFQGQPIVLQCWEQGMSLRRQQHSLVPVWIRLKHLPMEYWTEEGLSTVASGIGTPLYSDSITKDCSRLDYARVCVMLNYNSELPKHLVVISPVLRNGKEDPKRVDVEYEWLPQKCTNCCSLGHVETSCPANSMKKTVGPPIQVFVKKRIVPAPTEKNSEITGATNLVCNNSRPSGLDKGKGIALHNAYDALATLSAEENDDQLPGPNQCSPTDCGS